MLRRVKFWERKISAEEALSSQGQVVGEICRAYLDSLSERTKITYRRELVILLCWCEENRRKLIHVSDKDVVHFIERLKPHRKTNSLVAAKSSGRGIFAALMAKGMVKGNPFAALRLDRRNRVDMASELFPTREEYNQIIAFEDEQTVEDLRARACLDLAVFAFMNAPDIAGLRFGDYLMNDEGQAYLELGDRMVLLHAAAIASLDRYIDAMGDFLEPNRLMMLDDGRWERISKSGLTTNRHDFITDMLTSLCVRADVKRYPPAAWRSLGLRTYFEEGGSIAYAKLWTGVQYEALIRYLPLGDRTGINIRPPVFEIGVPKAGRVAKLRKRV